MKTVEELITRVRRETRNSTSSSASLVAGNSIDDAEIVDMLQDAQELCQELISGVFSRLFEKTITYTVTNGTTEYTLPTDVLLSTRVASVEFSYNGDEAHYYNLLPVDIRERESDSQATRRVYSYTRSANKIILMQKPTQTGSLRVVHEEALPRLDVAKITGASGAVVTDVFTGSWPASPAAHADVDSWSVGQAITLLNSADNSILVENGLITAIDTGARTISLNLAGLTYTEADIDTAGTNATISLIEGGRSNVSQLPNACEKFLSSYSVMSLFERDGSKLATAAARRYARVAESLLKAYIQEDRDFPAIPQTDY